jgi:hypothetical protein
MFQGANLEHAQIIAVAESGSTIIYNASKEDGHLHFPLNSTKDEGIRVHDSLTKESFMEGPIDSWLFLMGFVEQKPAHITAIKWIGNKEQLRVMLTLLFDGFIKEKSISVAEIERLTPCCFVDKKGNPMKLAKPREENSQRMDKLIEIFRPNSDL